MTKPAIAQTGRLRPPSIAVLAVLGALFLGACGNPPSPSPSVSATPSSSATPTASSSAAGSPAACVSADLSATGGPWGGAAGSRGSDIVVTNQGSAPCLLPAGPTVALVDQTGTVLLANTPPQVGAGPSIDPGATIGFSLVISNWCDQAVGLPLHFSLALASDAVDIGNLAVTTIDDLPPCNGPGEPASLSATDWQPS